mgnify:CR=1 FL=1
MNDETKNSQPALTAREPEPAEPKPHSTELSEHELAEVGGGKLIFTSGETRITVQPPPAVSCA